MNTVKNLLLYEIGNADMALVCKVDQQMAFFLIGDFPLKTTPSIGESHSLIP
jgi:hypothetical protein